MDFNNLHYSYLHRKYWLQGLGQSKLGKPKISSTPYQYFFIHLPKTTGTSFRFMLYNEFGQDKVFPNVYQLEKNDGIYFEHKKLKESAEMRELIQSRDVILGHFPYIVGKQIIQKPIRYLVFLRDPVKRTISHILHSKRKDKKCHDLSPLEIFELKKRNLRNLQTRWLSRNPWNFNPVHPKHSLNHAIDHLEQIHFIGLAEFFDLSIKLAEKTFDWNLGKRLSLNTKKDKQKHKEEVISEELLTKINEITAFDQLLYKRAKEIFDERLKQVDLYKR